MTHWEPGCPFRVGRSVCEYVVNYTDIVRASLERWNHPDCKALIDADAELRLELFDDLPRHSRNNAMIDPVVSVVMWMRPGSARVLRQTRLVPRDIEGHLWYSRDEDFAAYHTDRSVLGTTAADVMLPLLERAQSRGTAPLFVGRVVVRYFDVEHDLHEYVLLRPMLQEIQALPPGTNFILDNGAGIPVDR